MRITEDQAKALKEKVRNSITHTMGPFTSQQQAALGDEAIWPIIMGALEACEAGIVGASMTYLGIQHDQASMMSHDMLRSAYDFIKHLHQLHAANCEVVPIRLPTGLSAEQVKDKLLEAKAALQQKLSKPPRQHFNKN